MPILTIGANPHGSTAPSPGEYEYGYGESVLCVASPDPGYQLEYWDLQGSRYYDNPIEIQMYGDMFLVASFVQQTGLDYMLTIKGSTNGSTLPVAGQYQYPEGETVQIYATPAQGYKLGWWDVDGFNFGSGNPLQLVITGNRTVTCFFVPDTEPPKYVLTIVPVYGGTTDPAPGSHGYVANTSVPIHPYPDSGFILNGWRVDGTTLTTPYDPLTIIMLSDHTVEAVFTKPEKFVTELTLVLTPNPIHPSGSYVLSGRLVKSGYAVGVPGKTIRLYRSSENIFNAVTNSQGNYSAEATAPDEVGNYGHQAVFLEDSSFAGSSASATLTVRVQGPVSTKLTAEFNPLRVRGGALSTVSGRLTRVDTGAGIGYAEVSLAFKDQPPFLKKSTDGEGNYSITVTAPSPQLPGTVYYTVTYSGSSQYAPALVDAGLIVSVSTMSLYIYVLPDQYRGQQPSLYKDSDLRKTVSVNQASYVSPITVTLNIGASVLFRCPGASCWDYYGVGQKDGEEASYIVNENYVEIAAYMKAMTLNVFSLPLTLFGRRPSEVASSDLHRILTVKGTTYTTPFALNVGVGEAVTLQATESAKWDYYGVGTKTGSAAAFTMVQDFIELAAFFQRTAVKYKLLIQSTGGGTLQPAEGEHLYEAGMKVKVTATSDSDMRLDHWELDSVNAGSALSITVTMSMNHALKAFFTAKGEGVSGSQIVAGAAVLVLGAAILVATSKK